MPYRKPAVQTRDAVKITYELTNNEAKKAIMNFLIENGKIPGEVAGKNVYIATSSHLTKGGGTYNTCKVVIEQETF